MVGFLFHLGEVTVLYYYWNAPRAPRQASKGLGLIGLFACRLVRLFAFSKEKKKKKRKLGTCHVNSWRQGATPPAHATKFVRKVRSEFRLKIHAKTTKNKSRKLEYIQKATKQLSQLAAIGEQTVAFGCHFWPRGMLGRTENNRTNRKSEKSKKHGKHAGDWPSLALAVARLGRSDKPKGPTDAWNMCFLKHTPNSMKKLKRTQNDDAKMQRWKICVFWHMTRFLPKNGGLNGWTITGVLLKTSEKKHYKKGHIGKQEKINFGKYSCNKWRFKNQYVPTAQWFVWFKEKQGRFRERFPPERVGLLDTIFRENRNSRAHFGTRGNPKGHAKSTFRV